MQEVLEYYDREAALHPEETPHIRKLVERLLAGDLLTEFVLMPWDYESFGIFPIWPATKWQHSPCIGVWFDDPYPMYWVQLRREPEGEMLTCHQPMGIDEACESVAELLPQLAALAAEGRES